tara:strand:- start:575 stop:886 length:312 start_codon:yes stop_codon:yes gene_type:complete
MSSVLNSVRLVGDLLRKINRDAEELISGTVYKTTGQDFAEYIKAGNVPPLGLLFRAYTASAKVSAVRVMHANLDYATKLLKPPGAEILDPKGRFVGYVAADFE